MRDEDIEVNPKIPSWKEAANKINEKCASYEENKQTEIENIFTLKKLPSFDDDEQTSFDASIKYMKDHEPCWTGHDEMIAKINDKENFNDPGKSSEGGRLSRRKRKSRSKSKSKKTIKRKRRAKSKTKSKTKRKTNKTITKRKRIYK